MSASQFSMERNRRSRPGAAPPAPWLSTLTYRSRAVTPMSTLELGHLARSAQQRNRLEGITGMVIYDDGLFFQWLEGPAEGVERVWHSVSQDARHTDIELLGNDMTQHRAFGDWDMKLCSRPARATNAAKNVPLAARATLLSVVGSALMPELTAGQPRQHVDSRAGELARLLLSFDPEAAFELVADALSTAGSFAVACSGLFEPAARKLGDLWQTDDCSEFDVTVGLCRLQTLIRRLSASSLPHRVAQARLVLISPQPGEIHMLSAALEAEALWRTGWDVQSECPQTNDALRALVSDTWFDALSLTLSSAFRREHWLPRMTKTIALARRASRNPKLVVSVGGRIFSESGESRRLVGADSIDWSREWLDSPAPQAG